MKLDLKVSLVDAFGVKQGDLVGIVGAGGKTSLMYGFGRELEAAGEAVLLTTTTRIMYPERCRARGIVLGPESDETIERISTGLRCSGSVLAGSAKAEAKIVGFSPGFVDRLLGEVQPATVVAECDGARGSSLKVPDAHEPPLGESTAVLIVVVGADCIGKPVDSDVVYRPDLVCSVAGVAGVTVVTAEVVVRALLAPESYLGRLPQGARLCVMVNKADSAPGPAMEAAVALAAHGAVECVVVGALRTPGGRLMVVR